MRPEKLHTHDCDTCIHLGTAMGRDIYLHKSDVHEPDKLLIRYGSEGPSYEVWSINNLRDPRFPWDRHWLYALGLYDGYQRGREDGVSQTLRKTQEAY